MYALERKEINSKELKDIIEKIFDKEYDRRYEGMVAKEIKNNQWNKNLWKLYLRLISFVEDLFRYNATFLKEDEFKSYKDDEKEKIINSDIKELKKLSKEIKYLKNKQIKRNLFSKKLSCGIFIDEARMCSKLKFEFYIGSNPCIIEANSFDELMDEFNKLIKRRILYLKSVKSDKTLKNNQIENSNQKQKESKKQETIVKVQNNSKEDNQNQKTGVAYHIENDYKVALVKISNILNNNVEYDDLYDLMISLMDNISFSAGGYLTFHDKSLIDVEIDIPWLLDSFDEVCEVFFKRYKKLNNDVKKAIDIKHKNKYNTQSLEEMFSKDNLIKCINNVVSGDMLYEIDFYSNPYYEDDNTSKIITNQTEYMSLSEFGDLYKKMETKLKTKEENLEQDNLKILQLNFLNALIYKLQKENETLPTQEITYELMCELCKKYFKTTFKCDKVSFLKKNSEEVGSLKLQ